MKNTLVVNLIAGPGAHKSATMGYVFGKLKFLGVSAEQAPEFAKKAVWERRNEILNNQIYVFGKQHQEIFRAVGQVDVVITDSPIIFCHYYDGGKTPQLKEMILNEYNKVNNLNVFIERTCEYDPNGRLQTKEEAEQIDVELRQILQDNGIPYLSIPGTLAGADYLCSYIVNCLESDKDEDTDGLCDEQQ